MLLPALLIALPAVADEGMWLFTHPPRNILQKNYDFQPDAAWLEHIQKSCVRFGRGGSASLVSADGLVMTNHHVGSDAIEKLSTAERNLIEDGFYAPTRDVELKCDDLELQILWSIEDVTAEVNAAVSGEMSPADAGAARRRKIAEIEARSQADTGLYSEVVTLYRGAWYHLYRYKRYDDVRLVWAPELRTAAFGGDVDNFEYPRYSLDVAFFRIYENGKPLEPAEYLRFASKGVEEEDLVFVTGHPARTQRILTVDHLKLLRDVVYPTILQRLWRREVQLLNFCDRSEENRRIGWGDLASVQNSRKAFTGYLNGLQDPAIFATKVAAEKRLRDAVEANPEYRSKWGDAWPRLAEAEREFATYYGRYSALEGRRAPITWSSLFSLARHIVRLTEELEKPSEARLSEYRDTELESLKLRLYSPAPIYDALEIETLASGLAYLAETFGADDPLVATALAGRSPRAAAEDAVRHTRLKDVPARKALVEGGVAAVRTADDPLLRLARVLDADARALRARYEDEVESVESEAYAKIAAAQFAVLGDELPPDATGTLRMSFGPVRGFVENGQPVPPYTTLAGLFDRAALRKHAPPFDLRQNWIDAKPRLDLHTPYNFVSTAEVIGGNSGSPVLNRAGQVVGIIFDINLQGLVWDTAYSDAQARSVAVDVRAIMEALTKVYRADALVKELTAGHGE